MSLQPADRLVPISSAIFVPLATTVAWLMSRRTMRPRRTSVALCTDGRLRVFVEAAMEGIITSRWSLGQSLVIGRWSLAIETVDYPDPRTTDDQRPTTAFYAGVTLKLISTAVDECVSAPTEMKSTPGSAYA